MVATKVVKTRGMQKNLLSAKRLMPIVMIASFLKEGNVSKEANRQFGKGNVKSLTNQPGPILILLSVISVLFTV